MKIDYFRKSLLAGILIGIGGFAFLSISEPLVGACLFPVGLLSVILLGCSLYTGRVGYARSVREIPGLAVMCLINMAGAALTGLVTGPVVRERAEAVAAKKLDRPLLHIFILAVICGALIYLAVEMYKRTKNVLVIIIPVVVFVASGAEHCIADVYYFAAAMTVSPAAAACLMVCVAGNAAGSLAVSLLQTDRG